MDSFTCVSNLMEVNDPMNLGLSPPFMQVFPDDVSFLSQPFTHTESVPSTTFLTHDNLIQDNTKKTLYPSLIICIICGKKQACVSKYHKHNIKAHTNVELSRAILKLRHYALPNQDFEKFTSTSLNDSDNEGELFTSEIYDQFFGNDPYYLKPDGLDEVIELGPTDSSDILKIQSRLVKNSEKSDHKSQKVIEVKENNPLSTTTHDPDNIVVKFGPELLHTKENLQNHKHANNSDLKATYKMSVELCQQNEINRKIDGNEDNSFRIKFTDSKVDNPEVKEDTFCDLKCEETNSTCDATVVKRSRSGRVIKPQSNSEIFMYYDKHDTSSLTNLNKIESNLKSDCTETASHLLDDSFVTKTNISGHSKEIHEKSIIKRDPKKNGFVNSNDHCEIENGNCTIQENMDSKLNLPVVFKDKNDIETKSNSKFFKTSNGMCNENTTENQYLQVSETAQNNFSSECVKPAQDVEMEKSTSVNYKESGLKKKKSCNKTINSQKQYKCNFCDKDFNYSMHLKSHTRKYHENTDWMKYKCTKCNESFGFILALERHLKQHNPLHKFSCEQCGKVFKKLINLKNHIQTHNKDNVYCCPYCPKKYYVKMSFNKHLQIHTTAPKYVCEPCGKNFHDKTHYNKHLTKHLSGSNLGRSKYLKCNNCNDLKSVEIVESLASDGAFHKSCVECKKGFYKHYLIEHNNSVNVSNYCVEKEKTCCNICGKWVRNLKRHHKSVHTENEYVSCDICNVVVSKASLPSHKNRKHGKNHIKCDHCNKIFKNIVSLQEHLTKLKQKNKLIQSNSSKTTDSQDRWKIHMEKQELKCNDCGKSSFTNNKDYLEHLDKCRTCSNCNESSFSSRNDYLNHIETCTFRSINLQSKDIHNSDSSIVCDSYPCKTLVHHTTTIDDNQHKIIEISNNEDINGTIVYPCPIVGCNNIMHYNDDLTEHLILSHNAQMIDKPKNE